MNPPTPTHTARWWPVPFGDCIRRVLSWFALPVSMMNRSRVPVILQMNAVECGAACLAMILSYYRRKTQVAECRASCGVGRDGLTARTIAEAARNHGLRVKAFSLEPADLTYI